MARQFTAVYKKLGKLYLWVEEIPGVNTQGKTLKENLKEALGLILETNRYEL